MVHLVDGGRHLQGQPIDVADRAGIGQRPIRIGGNAHDLAPIQAAQVHEIGIHAPVGAGDPRLTDEPIVQHRRDDRQLVGLKAALRALEGIAARFGIGPAEESFGVSRLGQDVARAEMPALEIFLVGRRLEIEAGAPVLVDVEQAVALDVAAELVGQLDAVVLVRFVGLAILDRAGAFDPEPAIDYALPVFDIEHAAGMLLQVAAEAEDRREGDVLVRRRSRKSTAWRPAGRSRSRSGAPASACRSGARRRNPDAGTTACRAPARRTSPATHRDR